MARSDTGTTTYWDRVHWCTFKIGAERRMTRVWIERNAKAYKAVFEVDKCCSAVTSGKIRRDLDKLFLAKPFVLRVMLAVSNLYKYSSLFGTREQFSQLSWSTRYILAPRTAIGKLLSCWAGPRQDRGLEYVPSASKRNKCVFTVLSARNNCTDEY